MEENKAHRVAPLVIWVFLLLSGVSAAVMFLPGFPGGGKANIYSDIIKRQRLTPVKNSGSPQGSSALAAAADSLSSAVAPTVRQSRERGRGARGRANASVIPIEDFSADSSALQRFFGALHRRDSLNRVVRIAFLGDSFVEGDIFTAELRDFLQDSLGGGGVGFVNITSPVNKFRQTVVHDFSGWQTFSVLNTEPQPEWHKIGLSGQYSLPEEGALLSYKLPSGRYKQLGAVDSARFFFRNEKNCRIWVSVNGASEVAFLPRASTSIQILSFGDSVSELSFRFEQCEGFTAFGLQFDDRKGVSVDNYALRGASGSSLASVSPTLAAQWNRLAPVDLLVLEYGLNVVSAGVLDYNYYRVRMMKSISTLKRLFPDADILLMGIGDRSAKIDGEMQTMPEVKAMVALQREMAREAGIAHWSLFDAMGGENSMVGFAEREPAWAAKDYTHMSALGGRVLARKFFAALMNEYSRYDE